MKPIANSQQLAELRRRGGSEVVNRRVGIDRTCARAWKTAEGTSFAGICFLALTLICGRAVLAAERAESAAQKRGSTSVTSALPLDLDGKPVDPFQSTAKASVFIFLSPDCPIANRYAPEIQRLAKQFEPKGAKFWLVYADGDVSAATVRAHLQDYRHSLPALRDTRHWLVKRAGARVTPEAAVFNAAGKLVYHGRIDDRFADFGKERATPTTCDLADALEACLAGRSVPVKTTRAIGCYIYGAE